MQPLHASPAFFQRLQERIRASMGNSHFRTSTKQLHGRLYIIQPLHRPGKPRRRARQGWPAIYIGRSWEGEG